MWYNVFMLIMKDFFGGFYEAYQNLFNKANLKETAKKGG